MDLIERKAAIDALKAKAVPLYKDPGCNDIWERDRTLDNAIDVIRGLPSAQPKIIYCGDCRYKDDGIDEDGIPFLKCINGRSYGGTRINDFCSWGERKEDG